MVFFGSRIREHDILSLDTCGFLSVLLSTLIRVYLNLKIKFR
nr:MAG TPA: hypothetical protein [Caudoviricetes sp.]